MKKIKLWWYKKRLAKVEMDMAIYQCYSYKKYIELTGTLLRKIWKLEDNPTN